MEGVRLRMMQHKRAYHQYDTGSEYLCEVIAADLRPFPSFGPDAPCMALKIVLIVRSRVIDAGNTEPVGHEAMLWVPVDKDLHVLGLKREKFVRDAGIHLDRGRKPEIDPSRVVACRFGDPDPEFGYQPVLLCQVIDPAAYSMVPTPKLNHSKPFGLDWDERTCVVWRMVRKRKKEAKFGGNVIPLCLLRYLCDNIGQYCSNRRLSDYVWDKIRRYDPPDANTIQKHIGFIRKQIKPLGLKVDCQRTIGYQLAEA